MKWLLRTPKLAAVIVMKAIDKNYVQKKIAMRTGECRKCGECCRYCGFLDGKTKLCTVYDNRPLFCYKEFPLDSLDQRIWDTKQCGFKFKV